jgi:hypothetical protein
MCMPWPGMRVLGSGAITAAVGIVVYCLLHLAPVLLGDGIRLFDVPVGLRVGLEPTHVSRTGQLTDLRFSVKE